MEELIKLTTLLPGKDTIEEYGAIKRSGGVY